MQHRINAAQHGPAGADMVRAIQACVHCGLCLSACPTYQVLGEEMDSPRGRIYLIKNVLEGEIGPGDAQPYLDRCLGCLGCMPACPSGVPYDQLLIGYRSSPAAGRRSRLDATLRRLLTRTLPYPGRFRAALWAGRLGRPLRRLLPRSLRPMLDLLPGSLPAAPRLPEVYPARGTRRARVALLTGCVQGVLAPEINWATLRVLAANGVETVIPAGQGCCGALAMHVGDQRQGRRMARRNLAAFSQDVDAVITTAAGCGSGMHEYPLLFAGTPDQPLAEAFAARVVDVTVFLDRLGLVPPLGLPTPLRAAYHDACHLLHAQGVRDEPRRLLRAVPNLELCELNDGGMCCGSAGVYNLLQPEIAGELGQRKAARIIDTRAQAVVTGNIGCLMQIHTHLNRLEHRLPVYHTMTLLDLAYHRED